MTGYEKAACYHHCHHISSYCDITFGNCNYMNQYGGTNGPEGWFIKTVSLDGGKSWYVRLAEDPSFCALVKKIWKEHYTEISDMTKYMDQQALLMFDAQKRNFEKWNILNKLVWPNVSIFGSYEKEVEYLKDFYTHRVEWLDQAPFILSIMTSFGISTFDGMTEVEHDVAIPTEKIASAYREMIFFITAPHYTAKENKTNNT